MHGVRQPGVLFSLLLVTLFTNARRTDSQATVDLQNAKSYGLSVSVDEVLLTFHAADTHGLPINDLKLEELSLVDNGKPPRKILSFQSVRDLPLRAGILIDTSESMQQDLAGNQAISIKYLQRLVRQPTDLAFVMKFGQSPRSHRPGPAIATRSPQASAGLPRPEQVISMAQRFSTLSTRHVSTSSATSIGQVAEISSCFSPTAKTMPGTPL